jgi:nitrogen fixation protein FixH
MKLFPGIIFGLLGLNVSIVGLTVYFATRDKSAAVEPGYDAKALHYQRTLDAQAASRALGWTARVEPGTPGATGRVSVVARFEDRDGTPLSGLDVRVLAFRSVRASDRREWSLREVEPGRYEMPDVFDAPGRWIHRITATRGASTFLDQQETLILAR